MTREEAKKTISKMLAVTDLTVRANMKSKMIEACHLAIEALEQEPIDYKTQYENYLKKSGVVISQLRADRDRLQDAFDKVRAEIANHCGVNTDYCDSCRFCTDSIGVREILQIIDKYKAESEDKK